MSYDSKLSVIGKKRERDLQITESKKYSELLRNKLTSLNEAECFIDTLYTNVYHNATKLNVLFELSYGELPMKDSNKLTIASFIDIAPLIHCITSYKQCYEFYVNTVALFVHYNTNSNDDALFNAQTCAFIPLHGKCYILINKSFENNLKFNLNISVLVNKCDYMLIEITDVDVLIALSNVNDVLKDLGIINQHFISAYQTLKTQVNVLEQQIKNLNYSKNICEYDKYQQLHNLNVKLHEVELQNRILMDNENERRVKYKTYLLSTFSFEILCESKCAYKDNNIEPLTFTNIYEEITGKDECQSEKYLCTICLENERNVFFPKCGHCVVCFECLGGLKKEGSKYNCPSCRKFSNIQKIIFS
jgi:hypothetical protein